MPQSVAIKLIKRRYSDKVWIAMSKIVSSPIFMPRLMNQDGAATEIGKLPASLMTANIAAHYKNLATKARNASELFVVDPMTNNMVYDAFTEKRLFKKCHTPQRNHLK